MPRLLLAFGMLIGQAAKPEQVAVAVEAGQVVARVKGDDVRCRRWPASAWRRPSSDDTACGPWPRTGDPRESSRRRRANATTCSRSCSCPLLLVTITRSPTTIGPEIPRPGKGRRPGRLVQTPPARRRRPGRRSRCHGIAASRPRKVQRRRTSGHDAPGAARSARQSGKLSACRVRCCSPRASRNGDRLRPNAAAVGVADAQLELVRLRPIFLLLVLTDLEQDRVSTGPHQRRRRGTGRTCCRDGIRCGRRAAFRSARSSRRSAWPAAARLPLPRRIELRQQVHRRPLVGVDLLGDVDDAVFLRRRQRLPRDLSHLAVVLRRRGGFPSRADRPSPAVCRRGCRTGR